MSPDTWPRRLTISIVAGAVALAVAVTVSPGTGDLSVGVAGAVDTTAPSPDARRAALGATSRYAPISPLRVLDTRSDVFRGRLPTNGLLSMAPITPAVASASGVPGAGAAAVVLNITMVDPAGATYATVWPTGSPQPTVSSLNADTPMQTVANLVTVPVGVDGFISLYSSGAADYIVDVQGVYANAGASTSGRFVPIEQRRVLDTRTSGPLGSRAAMSIDLTAVGVPATASAAILNVTATNTAATGFLTVWPTNTPMPLASNLNVPGAGATVANQVIARVTNGAVSVFTEASTDLIVDVSGYMTGTSDPSAANGLYVALAPARLLDTRSVGDYSNGLPLGSGATIALPIAARGGVPTGGVLAVAVNATATRTHGYGYITGWPANTPIPATSSLNFVAAGRTVANHAITALNAGAVNFYSFGGADLLVDLMGYWTDGSALPPSVPHGPLTINTVNAPATTTAPGSPGSFGPHAFLYDRPGSGYGRWNPCRPIVYMVNADRGNQVMVDQLNLAVAEIERASGLDFVYGGPTSQGLDYSTPAGADAVLGFSDAAATPDLAGTVIGVGGGMFDPGSGRVVTGFALADVEDVVSMDKLRATFMHEIAHMVGLDHVSDSGQLMYFLATSISTFRNGDLEGLWRVGAAQGCLAGDRAPTTDHAPSATLPNDEPATVLVVRT